jgi:hypothetical protein
VKTANAAERAATITARVWISIGVIVFTINGSNHTRVRS